MSFGANNNNTKNGGLNNTIENAWERGLRQAKELCAKKNHLDKKFSSTNKSLEGERKQRLSNNR